MLRQCFAFILSIPFSVGALATGSSALAKVSASSTDIVGGVEAARDEFPFMVSLHQSFTGHFCGAALIRPNWILTAAHCMGGRFKVYVGLHSQNELARAEQFATAKVIIHPNYNESTMDYDYALVQLNGNSAVTPIAVNTEDLGLREAIEPIQTTTAGWGLTTESGWRMPTILNKVDVPVVNHQDCRQVYNSLTERMFCAGFPEGGKDSCQGDSGGPIFTKRPDGSLLLLGTVSFGEGCARPQKYGVYTDISAVKDWVFEEIRSH